MEPRNLLAGGTWRLEGSVLFVDGTQQNDHVLLSARPGGKVALTLNGKRSSPLSVERIVVSTLAGNDTVRADVNLSVPLEAHGGNGRDYLAGGRGPDQLFGDAGDDLLYGNGGDDLLDGGTGHDQAYGSTGSDTLVGDDGNDLLDGGAQADLAIGGRGRDRVFGGLGNDLLIGGDDADQLNGGANQNSLVAGQTVFDTDLPELQALLAPTSAGSSTLLDQTTVLDDQDRDQLIGAGGLNRFFMGPSDTTPGRTRRDSVVVTTNLTAPLVNRAIATRPGVQNSPSVAINPNDPRNVVIAYMDYSLVSTGYAGIGVATSHDGGLSWRHSALALPAEFSEGAANPIAKFDRQGRAYVSFMAADFLGQQPPLTNPDFFNNERGASDRTFGYTSNNGLFVARSDNGGLNWNAPAEVVGHRFTGTDVPFDIMPDLDVDAFPRLPNGALNPNFGNLYMTWTRIYPRGGMPGKADTSEGGSDLMIAVSRDGGQTWQTQLKEKEFWNDANGDQVRQDAEVTTAIVTVFDFFFREFSGTTLGQGYVDHPRVAVGPEGDVYVSAWTGGTFAVLHSADAGASFLLPDLSNERQLPFGVNFEAQPDSSGLPHNRFRTFSMRGVAADPERSGQVYAVEPIAIRDDVGTLVDGADVFFARSTDHGINWQGNSEPGEGVLNDDNDGLVATGDQESEVIAGQALARMAVDARGNIGVIWYDTRRDPADHLLDVFGSVSTDGGQSFSPNFRITSLSFDADAGAFIDATGEQNFFLGDFLGLALANQAGHAAWTDTRNGDQDIFFTTFRVEPAPAPPNDRFEPNNTPDLTASPTKLGRVVDRVLPKLHIRPGDEDWFLLETAAAGQLTVQATQAIPGDHLELELWNKQATQHLATGVDVLDGQNKVVGQRFVFPTSSGQEFQVRVRGTAGSPGTRYALALTSLTSDLGTGVHGVVPGSLEPGEVALYRLAAGATGSLQVVLTPAAGALGNLNLAILDLEENVLALGQPSAGGTQVASLPVRESQEVLLRVTGVGAAQGDFALEFTNLDQFTTPGADTLFFQAGAGPSQAAYADFNNDDQLDLVVSNALSNTISVLTSNGDGTFQAPRQFEIGAYVPQPSDVRLPAFRRDIAVADLNHDNRPDVVVTNEASSDISVLLGQGDGTFQPQRRFDATPGPFALDVGDINNDTHTDVVAVNAGLGAATVAVLLGRGNGGFLPQQTFSIFPTAANPVPDVRLAHLNADANLDLIISGDSTPGVEIYLGNGDGTFTFDERYRANREGPEAEVADIDGDGLLDIVVTSMNESGEVSVLLGTGDGKFGTPRHFFAGQGPIAVEVVDFGSAIEQSDGSFTLGPRDGRVDLVVAASGLKRSIVNHGDPGILILPGQFDTQGGFLGFGAPIRLLTLTGPMDLDVHDANADGEPDIAIVDGDGVLLLFGQPPDLDPNDSQADARDLGTVTHVVEPALTITPLQREAWFRFTVPAEVVGTGDQVLDISGGFAHEENPGLAMEVLDAAGNLLGAGERVRIVAAQGEELFLHVFGQPDGQGGFGAGAYSLVIDVLPQVAAIEAHALVPGAGGVPGGPTTSIVLTFQGDRLDALAATNPAHYRITWLGPNGQPGGGDDQQVPLSAGARPVVYSPGSNVNIGSGTNHPTATRQTVTLLFDSPLPVGSYRIELSAGIQSADFNPAEDGLLAENAAFNGHPVAQQTPGGPISGTALEVHDLVFAAAGQPDFSGWEEGTPFLSQLHDDLGAILDLVLSNRGDDPALSDALNNHIRDRIAPGLATGIGLLVFWIDPADFDIEDPSGNQVGYDSTTDTVTGEVPGGYVDVINNIEVIVILTSGGDFGLTVSEVPLLVRGGYVFVDDTTYVLESFTDEMRAGETIFEISLP